MDNYVLGYIALLSVGIAQGLFLMTTLLNAGQRNASSKRYLAALIVVFIVVFLNQMLIETRLINGLQLFFEFANLLPLLIGPLIYLYTISLINKIDTSFTVPKYWWLHGIPFLGAMMFFVMAYALEQYTTVIRNSTGNVPWQTTMLGSFKGVHIFLYAAYSFYVKVQYAKAATNARNQNARLNFKWLTIFLSTFLLAWMLALLDFVAGHFSFLTHPLWEILPNAILMILLYAMAYYSIKYPILSIGQKAGATNKYVTSSLSPVDMERIAGMLREVMRSHNMFLEPDLNLEKLAVRVNTPKHHISQTLNDHLNLSFQEFVNSYRIEEAKRLLKEHCHREKTILEIAYEAGFNSKAVFNRVFKQTTGLTPSVFTRKVADRI